MVDGYDNHISLLREGTALIAGKVMAGTGGETAAVEPYENRPLGVVVDSLGPDVQHQAVLFVHGLIHELEGKIVVAAEIPVGKGLALRGLGTVCAAHFDPVK